MGFFDGMDAASAGVWPDPERASAGMKEAAKGECVGSAGFALVEDGGGPAVIAVDGASAGAAVGAGAGAEADEDDDDDELNRLAQDLAGAATAGVAAGGGGAYDGAGMTGGGTDSSGGGPGGGWM